MSLRADDPGLFYVSPFQYFADTVPADVALVRMADLDVIEGVLDVAPAVQFHAALYTARLDVNAVVHTHSHWVAVVSSTGRVVGSYNMDAALLHDDQVAYEDPPDGRLVAGDVLAAALGPDRHVLLIKNHGAVIVGSTIEEATVKALTLERCAQLHAECVALRGTEARPDVLARAAPSYHRYFIPKMWEANVERLRISAPELFTVSSAPGASAASGTA